MSRRTGFLSLVVMLLATASGAARQTATPFQETTYDILGFHNIAHDAPAAFAAGARVINFTDTGMFAVIWVPPDYRNQTVRRVLVDLHGSASYAYTGLTKELPYAQREKYAIVALQWWRGGPGERYLSAADVYDHIDRAMSYMESQYGSQRGRAGLAGFSRGSVEGLEVMARDRYGKRYFAIGIHHSGAIPTTPPYTTFQQHLLGGLIPDAFAGQKFFLYCGERDEQRGSRMCNSMRFTSEVVPLAGGTVVQFIDDPTGLHGGYHLRPVNHEAGVAAFIAATADPSCTSPAAPSAFAVALTGRIATLRWRPSAAATSYFLEAGSVTGFMDLATFTFTGTSLAVAAPPGRYYVRVRAQNGCGASPASNEVVATVV